MRELLKFEYYRIFKSKIIWVMVGLSFALPMFAAIALHFIIKKFGIDLDDMDLDKDNIRYVTWFIISYFYERLPVVIALFAPLFIGRDYKDGFIRNKLTAGHTRLEIFVSAIVTQATVTAVLSVCYMLGGMLGLLPTMFGVDLNHGEMFIRAGTLLLSLIATTILFSALALLIKSRAGVVVIAIAFIFSFGIFNTLASSYSYSHKTIDAYEELYNETMERFSQSEGANYYSIDEMELDKDSYFNVGWYIGHPIFLCTNATLSSEMIPSFSTMMGVSSADGFFEYGNKIHRTAFSNSLFTLFSGNYASYLIDQNDIYDLPGVTVRVEEAELAYNIKSVLWGVIYFAAGYALFRKKNIF